MEEKIQQEIILKMWNEYPETRLCLFHVPNGGYRNALEGAKLKAMGVISGVPDLCLCWGGKSHWIELKAGDAGRLSTAQINLHKKWAENGIEVKVFRSAQGCIDYFLSIIK